MNVSPHGERFRRSAELDQPFGFDGEMLRMQASDLLLEIEPGPTERFDGQWTLEDRRTLEDWWDLEKSAPLATPALGISGESIFELATTLDTFHTSLPFSEAERLWLVSHHRTRDLDAARARTVEVVSSGVLTLAKGQVLFDRWHRWRREEGEFEGQGSLEIAVAALANISEVISRADKT